MSGKKDDLKTYLASKYMSGPKADAILDRAAASEEGGVKRRKKKRKVEVETIVAEGGGLVIADDDGMGWASSSKRDAEDEDESMRPVVETKRGQFKSSGATAWSTVREPEPVYERTPTPEPEDEAPVVVTTSRGGLQSVADLKAENERRQREQERLAALAHREFARKKKEAKERGEDEDLVDDPTATVYRDASGRKIDVKLEKAQQAALKRQEMEKEMQKMEWGKGLVQREEKEARQREAEKLKSMPMARYADDEDMNDELKDQERWNDPAAAFLTNKTKSKSKASKYPSYKGPPPPPNRFGIPPGYRWDGVDRGNGFEAKLMQRGNQRKVRDAEAYRYGVDDM